MGWAPVMHGPAPEQNIEVASPNRSFCMDEFQMYEEGKGGCCAGFTPAEGYWCSSKTSGGGAFTYRIPARPAWTKHSCHTIAPSNCCARSTLSGRGQRRLAQPRAHPAELAVQEPRRRGLPGLAPGALGLLDVRGRPAVGRKVVFLRAAPLH
jgi:hypothetical protein